MYNHYIIKVLVKKAKLSAAINYISIRIQSIVLTFVNVLSAVIKGN
jgi:hypothetical protein